MLILKNVSGFDLLVLGSILEDGDEIDITDLPASTYENDELLQAYISQGYIVVNDGVTDLPPSEGLVVTVAVIKVNGKTGEVVLTPDDLDDTTTVNKFFDAVSISKLDLIEALADVTDAENVEAAGAVMEADTSTADMSFVLNDPTFAGALEDNLNSAAATQTYIQNYVAGAITTEKSYKGGYDAVGNIPDLQTPAVDSVKAGDVYDVTAAGTFNPFGGGSHLLEIGDTLRAKVTNPETAADWVVVQNNLTPASIKTQYESNLDTNAFTDAEQAKLAGIEDNATADQTGAEIKSLYEAEPDTNAFTDAEKTKVGWLTVTQGVDLDQIESDTATNNAKITNATHSGDASGDTALTLQPAAIISKPSVDIEPTDSILFADNSDSSNLKRTTMFELAGQMITQQSLVAPALADEIVFADNDDSGEARKMTLADLQALIATGNIYGTEYGYDEENTVTSNATATLVTELTHIIPSAAPTGDYLVIAQSIISHTSTSGTGAYNLLVNGVPINDWAQWSKPRSDNNGLLIFIHTVNHTQGGGDTVLDLRFFLQSGAGSAQMLKSQIRRWRIS
jgi:hypothetical protein